MNYPRVYLAGPIRYCSYGEAVDWREEVTRQLREHHIEALSPMRLKEHLAGETEIAGSYDTTFCNAKSITRRDRMDVRRSDLLLVNFLGATTESIGTCIEFGWADAWDVDIVLVMEEDNVHEHPMIEEIASFHVTTIEEGVDACLGILNARGRHALLATR